MCLLRHCVYLVSKFKQLSHGSSLVLSTSRCLHFEHLYGQKGLSLMFHFIMILTHYYKVCSFPRSKMTGCPPRALFTSPRFTSIKAWHSDFTLTRYAFFTTTQRRHGSRNFFARFSTYLHISILLGRKRSNSTDQHLVDSNHSSLTVFLSIPSQLRQALDQSIRTFS